MQCMVLKMLTDFTLMYNACVGVILKRDAEGLGARGSSPPVTPSAKAAGAVKSVLFRQVLLSLSLQAIADAMPELYLHCAVSSQRVQKLKRLNRYLPLCRHVMHTHLSAIADPDSKGSPLQAMSEQTAMLLVAVCIRCAQTHAHALQMR